MHCNASVFEYIKLQTKFSSFSVTCKLCPELNANDMHAPYDKDNKVSSFVK